MEPETEAQPEEREEEEEEEEQDAPEEEEAQVEEPPPPPKPKRVRPSRAKVVVPEVPEVKKMGRPKKPPGAPKAKYTARKLPPEPVFDQSDQPPPERLVPSQMEPGDVVAMTRFMAEQIGSLQKTSFDTEREGWRNLVAGMYQ